METSRIFCLMNDHHTQAHTRAHTSAHAQRRRAIIYRLQNDCLWRIASPFYRVKPRGGIRRNGLPEHSLLATPGSIPALVRPSIILPTLRRTCFTPEYVWWCTLAREMESDGRSLHALTGGSFWQSGAVEPGREWDCLFACWRRSADDIVLQFNLRN